MGNIGYYTTTIGLLHTKRLLYVFDGFLVVSSPGKFVAL